MEQIKLNNELSISRLVQGVWRLADWDYSKKLVEELVEGCLELGIDTFDHADIYGDYACEELFGKALPSSLKQKLKIVTKCGIKLVSDKRPDHYVKHYDTSFEHIVWSAENSLKAMGIEAIDVLLIHRPDPFINPNEVARAFSQLKAQGKVKHFGVSNFLPSQFKALQAALDFKLVTNQIEISAIALHEFDNGSIDLCQELNMHPMAWSPLGGGSIFNAQTHRMMTLKNVLHKIGDNHGATIDQVMYAWLLAHPAGIIPVIGSGKLARIKAAADAVEIKLSRQEWFEIWVASKGQSVP
ncbi:MULTISPECIES: aldo/keto reductase [Roseivirga]|uniref:Oxidoreductase n=1 Tax=Roseivirga spongicola TaxID=333140 RepID=A0A150XAT9_9BACT|nr:MULTISPECIES: aldo/keto reductase [Roseivirga]KYG75847.1 oxidoreductase [Roseivirga spongicola]MBO6497210.1 aldo/keto reductase [Roseivirga sp.]MBO6662805.1 aldo/keto reductase [Roseivirga sp.]MBO6761818.1 aldo/keto reductase [Roseivirga sp.]MBO6909817.1 aldo/keto reductase [Roseivirga sp.]